MRVKDTLTSRRTAKAGERFAREPVSIAEKQGGPMRALLILILLLLLLGALPTWPYSAGWGYGPSGILGLVLVIILVLALVRRV